MIAAQHNWHRTRFDDMRNLFGSPAQSLFRILRHHGHIPVVHHLQVIKYHQVPVNLGKVATAVVDRVVL